MGYTNLGLVQHAKKLLAADTKYMWGGIARPITASYVDMLSKMYPNQYSASRIKMLKSLPAGYIGVDCVGTIKSYYWSGNDNGGFGSPKYGAAGYPDVNANVMYANAKEKGTISTIPEIPGLVVYCKSHPHVGVYIGNGEVIESTIKAAGDGVIKTKLKDWNWEYWFKCPYIQYVTEPKKLAVGAKVQLLKTAGKYAGSSISIPEGIKGKTYTVQQLKSDRALLKEIYSWVYVKDLKVV